MFTAEQRDRVRERLLGLAEGDPNVVGAAITGSYTTDGGDEWSDVDLAFGIRGELRPALEHWARILEREFGALHHWDLPWGSCVYRVFLLPGSRCGSARFGNGRCGASWSQAFVGSGRRYAVGLRGPGGGAGRRRRGTAGQIGRAHV